MNHPLAPRFLRSPGSRVTGARPPVLAAYLSRYGRMPTVKAGFRALPDPADYPTFRLTPAALGRDA